VLGIVAVVLGIVAVVLGIVAVVGQEIGTHLCRRYLALGQMRGVLDRAARVVYGAAGGGCRSVGACFHVTRLQVGRVGRVRWWCLRG
jgi:hypothetical protein